MIKQASASSPFPDGQTFYQERLVIKHKMNRQDILTIHFLYLYASSNCELYNWV